MLSTVFEMLKQLVIFNKSFSLKLGVHCVTLRDDSDMSHCVTDSHGPTTEVHTLYEGDKLLTVRASAVGTVCSLPLVS